MGRSARLKNRLSEKTNIISKFLFLMIKGKKKTKEKAHTPNVKSENGNFMAYGTDFAKTAISYREYLYANIPNI